jgi:hypothetical protein
VNLEDNSSILSFDILLEYLKLADGHTSCSRECCFSSLAFLKSKLWITLNLHLPLVVGIYSQTNFTLEIFPYATTFDAWIGGIGRYCVIAKMLEMV